jgi:hypothetical protein
MERLSPEHLRALRNHVPIALVIEQLGIPTYQRGRRLSFRCPRCSRIESAIHPERNLARCFPCRESFNTIDLVMAERDSPFLEAIDFLEGLPSPVLPPSQLWAPAPSENPRDYPEPNRRP